MSSRSNPSYRSTLVLTVILLLGGLMLAPAPAAAQATSKVYYVPVYEADLADAMEILESGNWEAVSNVATVVSIVASIDGTVIRYDHAEDGYELDIDSPTQASTQTWTLNAGQVLPLRNLVPGTGPAPGTFPYSGGDKVGASRTVAVTRVGWDNDLGPVIAGAYEVLDTGGWGLEYVVPVGEDVASESMFEKTFLYVMAKDDGNGGTTVTVARPLSASVDYVLTEGQSLALADIEMGTRITADAPVQAHLLAGDTARDGYLELRCFTLFPVSAWSESYFTPVGNSHVANDRTTIWLYNDGGTQITVSFDTQGTSDDDSFPVAAGAVVPFDMPVGLGGKFSSSAPFYAVATVNAADNPVPPAVDSNPDNDTWDWGFTLIPAGELSSMAIVGWGPGNSLEPPSGANNGSPIFVTAPSDTTLNISFDGDMTVESSVPIQAFESYKVFDASDKDQTGTRVWTTDGTLIAVAWGEDPDTAGTGSPYLDVGTTVLPIRGLDLLKVASLQNDPGGDGLINPGDTVTYTMTVINVGTGNLTGVVLEDTVPLNTQYVSGTTFVDGAPEPDDTDPDTPFPLDEGGLALGTMAPGEEIVVTFRVTVDNPFPSDVQTIRNLATVDSNETPPTSVEVVDPVYDPSILLEKSVYKNADQSSCPGVDVILGPTAIPITYCFQVTNTGNTYLYPVVLNDPDLGITNLDLTAAVGGGAPLAPGETLPFYTFASTIDGNLYNEATATGTVSTLEGTPVGLDDVEWTDWAEVQDLFVITGTIDIEKFTNGAQADFPDGPDVPQILVGPEDNVTWTYQITNQSDRQLEILLEDTNAQGTVPITFACPTNLIDPDQTIMCTVGGTATPGPYANVGTVTGDVPGGVNGNAITDSDPSHYFGVVQSIDLVKDGDFDDNNGDGVPQEGETITYSFRVENTGNVGLSKVFVQDLIPIVDVSGTPFVLAPQEVNLDAYTGTYAITQADIDAGFFDNSARATGTGPFGDVFDDDPHSEPLAQAPAIAIDKTIVWTADLDENDLDEGDGVTYVYTVVSPADGGFDPGSVDDPGRQFHENLPVIQCEPANLTLAGQSAVCSAEYVVTASDLTGPMPQTMVDTEVFGEPDAGDTITYLFEVDNTGNVTLAPVVVTDPLIGLSPIDCGDGTGTIASLAPDAPPELCSATFDLAQEDVDSGLLTNTAKAAGLPPGGEQGVDEVEDEDTELIVFPAMPAIQIVKTADVGTYDEVGDLITYTFEVTNTGNVTLDPVVVTDPLEGLSDIDCDDSTLLPGHSFECTATYTISLADLDAGSVTNTATATGTPPSGPNVSDTDDEEITAEASPAIDIVKTASQPTYSLAGEVITYTFTVDNIGNVTLAPVNVSDPLAGLSAIDCGDGSAIIASLAPDDPAVQCTATYTISLADLDAGSVTNTATATGTPPSGPNVSDTDDEEITAEASPAIDIVKTASQPTYSLAGEVITYTFTVDNIGNVTLAPVNVSDPLAGLSAIDCGDGSAIIASLAPDDPAVQCTATYTISLADLDAGSVTNTATATGTPPSGPNVSDTDDEEITAEASPAIDIVKTASQPTYSLAGEVITYTFTVDNIGNVTLAPVNVSDPLAGLSAIDCGDGSAIIASLAPDDPAVQCTATYTISLADLDAGSVTNTATATGTPPSGPNVSDTDDEEITAEASPAIDIVKTASQPTYSLAGEVITYTFTVDNIGNVTLAPVNVSDPLAGLSAIDCGDGSAIIASLAPDDPAVQCTATYTISLADLDAGSVTNTATATGTPPSGPNVSDTDDEEITAEASPAIDIVKTASQPTYSLAGEVITYTFTVDNIGNVTLAPVNVSDPLAGLSAIDCGDGSAIIASLAPDDPAVQCTATYTISLADLDAGSVTNTATATGTPPSGPNVSDTDYEEITAVQTGALDIEKATNGEDADEAPGPSIPVGDEVQWRFRVTNKTNVTVSNIVVQDDKLGRIFCAFDTLPPGASMDCVPIGLAVPGQYANMGSVTGTDPDGIPVPGDEDPSHYFGVDASIDIQKTPDLQTVVSGSDVTFDILVSNTSNVQLTNVVVSDVLAPACDKAIGDLAVGGTASYQCTANNVTADFTNVAVVTGTPPAGPAVTDDDDAVVDIISPSIDIEKATNGDDADTGPGPSIDEGQPVEWKYMVTNTGDVLLTGIQVTDDIEGAICTIAALAVGESQTCTKVGTAGVGSYENFGTATGNPPVGPAVSDRDPSHYFGVQTGISIPVFVNKTVAGEPIPEGVSFTFELRDADGTTIPVPVEIDWLSEQPVEIGIVSVGDYFLCELGLYPDWNSSLIYEAGAYHPVVDDAIDLSTVCVPFSVDEDTPREGITFNVNNTEITAEPLTIGYWKNQCEPAIKKGKFQRNPNKVYTDQLLYETGATISLGDGLSFKWFGKDPAGNNFKPHVDGYIVTMSGGKTLSDTGCWSMELILDKRDLVGDQQWSEDPAFNMAAQHLAAELNFLNGAPQCVGTANAIADADRVMNEIGFTGYQTEDGYAMRLEMLGLTDITQMLATILDNYNNSRFSSCSYMLYDGFPEVMIEKLTNGVDADEPTGPEIAVGGGVDWTYEITNTYEFILSDIVVSDDQGVVVACEGSTELAAGESMTCTGSGIAVLGQYANIGSVDATTPWGTVLTGSDPSHYLGVEP